VQDGRPIVIDNNYTTKDQVELVVALLKQEGQLEDMLRANKEAGSPMLIAPSRPAAAPQAVLDAANQGAQPQF
jgi:hypothetical protein